MAKYDPVPLVKTLLELGHTVCYLDAVKKRRREVSALWPRDKIVARSPSDASGMPHYTAVVAVDTYLWPDEWSKSEWKFIAGFDSSVELDPVTMEIST